MIYKSLLKHQLERIVYLHLTIPTSTTIPHKPTLPKACSVWGEVGEAVPQHSFQTHEVLFTLRQSLEKMRDFILEFQNYKNKHSIKLQNSVLNSWKSANEGATPIENV